MTGIRKYRRALFALAVFATASASFSSSAMAQARGNPNPQILPVNSKPFGLSYGEWSAKWWQWAFSMPVDAHPLYDTADCSAGQSGKVWFLGASFAPSITDEGKVIASATRTCTIPSGTALFIPIMNAEASAVEGLRDGYGGSERELRETAEFFQDFATNLTLEIDGRAVRNLDAYRVQSPLFQLGPLPENNVLQALGYKAPAGTITPSVADGVFVMLAPLPVGQHTIHFTGEIPDFNFVVDITYHITVVPRGR